MKNPWRKGCDSVNCIEVQVLKTIVKIRDSKNPDGPTLKFSLEEWEQFKDGINRGAFD